MMARFAQQEIKFLFTRINSSTDTMIAEFRKRFDGKEETQQIVTMDLSSRDTAFFKKEVETSIMRVLNADFL